jgi:hypothetical protein
MIEYANIEAGAGVLSDSIAGLRDRIKLAPGEVTSLKAWQGFKNGFAALATRIAVGTAAWREGDVATGLPWGIANSDQAYQQLIQWSGELETLWGTWAKLSGEKLPDMARPTGRIKELGGGLGGALSGISSVIWAVVGLGVLGLVGWIVWRWTR